MNASRELKGTIMSRRGGRRRSMSSPHPRRGRIVALTVAVMLMLAAAAQDALAMGSAWRIDSVSDTTVAAGDRLRYLLQLTNVGDAVTDGSDIELVATLPPGFTGNVAGGGGFACTAGDGVSPVAGASTVMCTRAGTLLSPSASRQVSITVAVDLTATGALTSTFEVSGGGGPGATTVDPTTIMSTLPGFGIDAFDGQVVSNVAGDAFTQAAGHPYGVAADIDFNTLENPILDLASPGSGVAWPVEATKDVLVDLPPGFAGNPTVAAKCTAAELANSQGIRTLPLCPPDSQLGTTLVRTNGFPAPSVRGPIPVFNMVPPPDVPARFGFNVLGTVVTLDAQLRSGSDYGLSVNVRNISEGLAIAGTSLTFWGVPADPSHDAQRSCAGQPSPADSGPSCTSGAPRAAFLRNPTSCTAPAGSPVSDGLITNLTLDSWVNPGRLTADGAPDLSDPNWASASFVSHVPPSYPAAPAARGANQLPTGCENVPFTPTLTASPASDAKANAPTGFVFDVTLPQSDDPNAIGQADLKRAVVTLPAGVRVSPSAATGLEACTPNQVGLHTTADAACSDKAKMGSLRITTPLLDEPLTGSIYLATPHDNPFDSLIAIYLVVKGPGVIVKLPGKVETDPNSGQLKATFDNNPQLPFSNLHLDFFSGPRAALVTPKECGTYTTHAELTSWSGKTVSSDSSFALDRNSDGSACAPSGFAPGFVAGTDNPGGGKDTSFLLSMTRGDRDQELRSLTLNMPTGLTARIANAVLCPDAAANAGACGDGSKLGGVTVGAGAGSNPFYITNGRAYITGPYGGAPFGLSIVVPAIAGPFDLGNVVVRAAIFIDRHTAAVRVVSDPLPTILDGIPLDVRDVRVTIDRPRFIINPTSCAEKQVLGTIGSVAGAIAHVSSRFRATDCANLPLAPKLTLKVGSKGHTKASTSTPFSATLTQTPGQANLRSVSVSLPTTLNALLPVVNRACKLTEFNAGTCTSKARVGSAVAVTPLLRDPLKGSAYFVKNPSRPIPDLMVALRGQVDFDLVGKVTIPGGKHLATAFDAIPDVPITKFTLKLVSGKNGPVGTAVNLCTAKSKAATAAVGFRGQNGKLVQANQRLHVSGCPKAKQAKR